MYQEVRLSYPNMLGFFASGKVSLHKSSHHEVLNAFQPLINKLVPNEGKNTLNVRLKQVRPLRLLPILQYASSSTYKEGTGDELQFDTRRSITIEISNHTTHKLLNILECSRPLFSNWRLTNGPNCISRCSEWIRMGRNWVICVSVINWCPDKIARKAGLSR